jgi:hypothetical protein
MNNPVKGHRLFAITAVILTSLFCAGFAQTSSLIGREIAVPEHLHNGQEFGLSTSSLIRYGEKLFSARWTVQEGQGRPAVKGTANGPRLSVPDAQLLFPHNFNRVSGPDSNAVHPAWIKSARASAAVVDNVENLRRRSRDAQSI